MDCIDLFAGCGGSSTGAIEAGINVKYAIDNNKECKATYQHNHPNTKFILADIKKLNPSNYTDVEIVIGSPPCQEFSVGNKDREPKLGMKLVNVFREWIDIIKPKWWIMENVAIIEQYLHRNDYPIIKVLNAANFGIPQKRQRCFAGMFNIPRQTHDESANIDLFGNRIEKWVNVIDAIGDLLVDIKPGDKITDQAGNVPMCNSPYFSFHEPARTVTSIPFRIVPLELQFDKRSMNPLKFKDIINETDNAYQKFTPRMMARLQSFKDSFEFFGSESEKCLMIGNAVPPLLMKKILQQTK